MGKGKRNYIEVLSDSEEEEDEVGNIQNMEVYPIDEDNIQEEGEEEIVHKKPGIKKEFITSISGMRRFSTLRIRGVLKGKRVIVLIDGGASNNFIDVDLVRKRHPLLSLMDSLWR